MRTDHRNARGFTLPEVLLASVLGAMLLTALTLNTYGFTQVLTDLEAKAGVSMDIDPILRQVTRDIREAQWATLVAHDHIELADFNGSITSYWKAGSDLMVRRPNGDEGSLFDKVEFLEFEAYYVPRAREGDPVTSSGTFYSASVAASSPLPMVIPADSELAVGFAPPVMDADVPGGLSGDQQVLGTTGNVLRVPIRWIENHPDDKLSVAVHESWGPGMAKPYGDPLTSFDLPGTFIPGASWGGTYWNLPDSLVSIAIPDVSMEPGVGYTVVLTASGDSEILVKGHPGLANLGQSEAALQISGGGWVTQPLGIPMEVGGSWVQTATNETPVISRITISLTPDGRPTQTRSASLLSQSVSDDPWLGVVPGETDL